MFYRNPDCRSTVEAKKCWTCKGNGVTLGAFHFPCVYYRSDPYREPFGDSFGAERVGFSVFRYQWAVMPLLDRRIQHIWVHVVQIGGVLTVFLRSKSINILVRYGCFGLALLWYMGSAGAVTQGTESETKKANCKNYEIVSLGQQQRNLKLKCGYFGAMWQSNAGSHYKWCYASPLESSKNVLADEQIKLRKEMLASCAKKESVKTICKRYARAVVTAIKQNRKRRMFFVVVLHGAHG